MQALPLALGALVALILAPAARRGLVDLGHVRTNYRQASLAFPFGVVGAAAATVALVPLALADTLGSAGVLRPELRWVAVYALGVALLGLVDDLLAGPARGWRGHGGALLRDRFSTGAVKAAGSLGLALYALDGRGLSTGRYLLASVLLVLATNLFNLFDLRPGRSLKLFGLLGVGITLGSWDVRALWALGLFVGPMLVIGLYDLRERAMLGDTGSNLLGALAGLWLVLTLSTTAQAIAVAVIAAVTLFGEFRSISEVIERTPLLRHLDSVGRPMHV